MNWNTVDRDGARVAFIAEYRSEDFGVRELAARHGISRKSAYKWIARFAAEGVTGLQDRSRAPQHHPNALSAEIEAAILACKARWPHWGAPKLWVKLQAQWGAAGPSESSISRVLQRHGLVRPVGRRRPRAQGTVLQECAGPNALWCADFKGWFKMGDGTICTPLTISDADSRYLLRCQGLTEGTGHLVVQPLFEATMREFGVPVAIRTDNGAPFASVGLGGLTPLSIWWLRLGIRLERSRPGCPQDNGRHERMHRTLKKEVPPQATRAAQQRAFDEFRREYNEERPHEALSGQTPASVYVASARDFPARLPAVEYAAGWEVRQVRTSGQVKWRGNLIYVSKTLRGQRVGFEPIQDGLWLVHFATHPLGLFDERTGEIKPLRGARKGR